METTVSYCGKKIKLPWPEWSWEISPAGIHFPCGVWSPGKLAALVYKDSVYRDYLNNIQNPPSRAIITK